MLLTYRYPIIIAVIAVVAVFTLAGCGSAPVATVDGVKITEQEVNERLVQAFGDQVLRSMIDRELLRKAAADRGVEITDEEMAEAVEEAKAQYGTEERFQQFLAENNISEEEWLEEVRIMVLARKLALHGIEPTEQELREFYEEHEQRFGQPATVSMSEIVVTSEDEARDLLGQLERGEASFADLAARYSLAPSREVGGEQPAMPIEQIGQPQIQQIARELPVGEVSEPIEIGGSWVILRVRDRTEARAASFERDREQIEEHYKMAHANDLEEILAEQIQKTNINIVDPRYHALNQLYTRTPDEIPQFGIDGGHEGHGHATPEVPVLPDTPALPDAE